MPHNYMLTTCHTDGVKIRTFDTIDQAIEAARATDPDRDGSMIPNVPDELIDPEHYERGEFWPAGTVTNRYAVIHTIRK